MQTLQALDGRASLVLNIFGWGFGLSFGCVNILQFKHGLEVPVQAAKTFDVELLRFIKIHCVRKSFEHSPDASNQRTVSDTV